MGVDHSLEQQQATFMLVTVSDMADPPVASASEPVSAPIIVERSMPGIEVELIGGRRVRFAPDVNPKTVHSLVTLLEGAKPNNVEP